MTIKDLVQQLTSLSEYEQNLQVFLTDMEGAWYEPRIVTLEDDVLLAPSAKKGYI